MKGYIIIGVVVLHLIILSGPLEHRDLDTITQCFYLGLMGFFIISGYFFRPDRSIHDNISKRLKQLLISIVIVGVVLSSVMFLWMNLWGNYAQLGDLIGSIVYSLGLAGIGSPTVGESMIPLSLVAVTNYFMWVMLISFVVFYPTAKRVVTDKRMFIAAIVILLVIECILAEFFQVKLPFFIQLVPIALAFMYSGAFLAQQKVVEKVDSMALRDYRMWIPLVICAVSAYLLVWAFPNRTGFDLMIFGDYGGYSVFPFYVESILMFVVYTYMCMIISRIPLISSVFTLVGKHTLALTFLHGFVAKFMLAPFCVFTTASMFPSYLSDAELLLVSIVTIIVIVVGCILRENYLATRKAKE